MKPASPTPHDPLDELLAAALHGELTGAQRAELDALLQHDPAARAAYQETQAMHDLLERNHRNAQPDAAFEERLISGVRQKKREEKNRETAWESVLVIWRAVKWPFMARPAWTFATVAALCILAVTFSLYSGWHGRGVFATISSQLQLEQVAVAGQRRAELDSESDVRTAQEKKASAPASIDQLITPSSPPASLAAPGVNLAKILPDESSRTILNRLVPTTWDKSPLANENDSQLKAGNSASAWPSPSQQEVPPAANVVRSPPAPQTTTTPQAPAASLKAATQAQGIAYTETAQKGITLSGYVDTSKTLAFGGAPEGGGGSPAAAPAVSAAQPSRKLVRDAQLDLQVKSYQPTVDAITALATADGGYVDSSNSQRGGNGKLQGSVVAKVLPENLDAFLLKLRGLGEIKNQSVSTEDVTKDYYDTQARLANSRLVETQLQQLLAHNNGKVSDLLQVEREIERVRGEIEQMQGQLKLYDFQVQYATVTISVAEKDLHQAAAYLLRESDQSALFTGSVEDAFAQAKAAADTFKAEILNADLQHDSDNQLSATLAFSVPPDQIDGFLAKVKSLGRVDNFTRQTQRVANDGGDPGDPSDQTRTEKDHVQVQLTIRADDETPRQQTQLAIASTGDIDAQAQALKDGAAKENVTVTASNFERATDGTETATLSFRLPLAQVGTFMPELQKLGRVESLVVERHDRSGQAAADPGAPAEIDLRLHNLPAVRFEDETPRQQTQLAVASKGDVDAQAQQVKADALQAGYALTASTFNRSPDGTEQAAITFRLPLTQAAALTATLEKLGRVESLAVQRNDVTGPNSIDPNAPAEISLDLHSEPAVVAENHNFVATLRNTFGGAVAAFLGSIEAIGILVAYLVPWVCLLALAVWGGRRAYVVYRAKRAA